MKMKRGFTLIELLVVVLLIGILSAVGLPKYQTAVDKADFVKKMAFLREIKRQEELYFMENGSYAYDWNELDLSEFPHCRVLEPTVALCNNKHRSVINKANNVVDIGADWGAIQWFFAGAGRRGNRIRCCGGENDRRAERLCLSMGGTEKQKSSSSSVCWYITF